MSLNSPILSRRSAAVAAQFDAKAEVYDEYASLQARIAARLAKYLPDLAAPRVLELGCGTGLFSRHLVSQYPRGQLYLTDAAPGMIGVCRRNLEASAENASFEVMDATAPFSYDNLDLIVTSMMLHWLPDPTATLARLRRQLSPGGMLLFATPGPHCFAEWRTVLATEGLPCGIPDLPEMPGVVDEEHLAPDRDSLSFLRRMKAVGGLHPRDGYEPLSAGELRKAIRATNIRFGGQVTWHIVYGRLKRA